MHVLAPLSQGWAARRPVIVEPLPPLVVVESACAEDSNDITRGQPLYGNLLGVVSFELALDFREVVQGDSGINVVGGVLQDVVCQPAQAKRQD